MRMNKYIFNQKLNKISGILCLFTLLWLLILGQQGELYRYLDVVEHENKHVHRMTSVTFHNQQHLVLTHANQQVEDHQQSHTHSNSSQFNHSEEEHHHEQHEYHVQSTDIDALIALSHSQSILDYVFTKSNFYKLFSVVNFETIILQARPPPWSYQILTLLKSIILLI